MLGRTPPVVIVELAARAAVILGGQDLEIRRVHVRVRANVVVAGQLFIGEQVRDGGSGLASRPIGEIAAVGVGVDGQNPIGASNLLQGLQ
jgi:hypothetical protein